MVLKYHWGPLSVALTPLEVVILSDLCTDYLHIHPGNFFGS